MVQDFYHGSSAHIGLLCVSRALWGLCVMVWARACVLANENNLTKGSNESTENNENIDDNENDQS